MLQTLFGATHISPTSSLSTQELEQVKALRKSFDAEVKEYLKQAKSQFKIRFNAKTITNNSNEKTLRDFILYQCLGSGAFARVYLAREYIPNSKYVAMKLLDKRKIIADQQEVHVMSEKRILSSVDFPFIIQLYYGFQDPSYLCLGLEFMHCGELFAFLRTKIYFSETVSRFYCAQVLMALEYLHHLDIAYRDLKPENILIDDNGYLKIADFGFAKLVPNRTYTLCGTPEYLAPEIIQSKGYSRAVDWWAFGVLTYELAAGYSPFVSHETRRIYEKILTNKYNFPKHFSRELRTLLKKLLESDISKRIGCLKNKVDEIKQQKWFHCQIEWRELFYKTLPAPQEFIDYKRKRQFKLGNVTNLKSAKVDKLAAHFGDF